MNKKILLIGATGTIGQLIQKELQKDNEVINVGNRQGDYQVDITNSDSIRALYQSVSDIDAVVCAAARGVVFAPLQIITKQQFIDSMQGKLLGQIDLVLQGLAHLKPTTSFTLTTGILNVDPIAKGSAAASVNSAIEGFTKAAAIDVPNKQRINVISPALLEESEEKYRDFFPGYSTVPGKQVARAYRKAIFGQQTGEVIKVGW